MSCATRALLLVAAVAGPAAAQRTAVLRGNVLADSSERPIAGAEVSVPALKLAARADSLGRFRFGAVPPGDQLVSVRHLGFEPLSAVLALKAGDSVDTDFLLVATRTVLPRVDVKAPVHVGARLAGFEERRTLGFGHFITQEQIEKQSHRTTADILRTIPGPFPVTEPKTGIMFVASARGQQSIEGSTAARRAADVCAAAVYLDGIQVYGGEGPRFDINTLKADDLAGIEFYGGGATIPAQFNKTNGQTCGVLLVWTK